METTDIKVEDFTDAEGRGIKYKMDSISTTVCVRCGKQRIVLSVKEETIGTSAIVTTETICPDPECQKKVDGMLGLEQEKRHQSFLLREKKMSARKQVKTSN
jgi:hypothetical protein